MRPSPFGPRTWRLTLAALLLAAGCGKQADPAPRDVPKPAPTPPARDSRPDGPIKPPPQEAVSSEPATPGPPLSPTAYVRTPPVRPGQSSWTIESEKSLPLGPGALQFTSDGQLLLQAEMSPWVRWDFGRETLVPAPCAGNYTVLSPDGKSCVRVEDRVVQLLDASGPVRATISELKLAPQWTAFAPDGKLLATGVEEGLWLWDAATGAKVRTSEKKFPDFSCAAFAPDGKTVVLAQVTADRKAVLSLLPVETARVEQTLTLDAPLHTLSWSPDGKRLAAVDWDGRLVLIELAGLKVLYTGTKEMTHDARPAWTADGQGLVVAGKDFGVAVWNLGDGKVLRTCRGHTDNVNALALSPDGKTLVSAGADRSVRFWDFATGNLRGTLLLLPEGGWLAVSAGGHYKGSPKVEEQFAYRVEAEKFRRLVGYTPLEFARRYGWVNRPDEVRLSPR
jgi:WD40 repeat protein